MNKFSRTARSVTFAAIVGLSLGVSAPGAFAETAGEIANKATKGQSTITQETGTFTVHKRANTVDNKQNDGSGDVDPNFEPVNPAGNQVESAPGSPLNGAEFKLYEVFISSEQGERKVDLKTNESIKQAASISKKGWIKDGREDKYTLTVKDVHYVAKPYRDQTKKTEGAGTATWDTLPIGAYFVVESHAPEGFTPSAPFVAYVPMTVGNAAEGNGAGDQRGGGTTWNYDVHAYPKNYKSTAKKQVEDSNMNAGDKVKFTITSDVPNVDEKNTISRYTIEDDLQENLISTTAEAVVVVDFQVGEDYNVTVEASTQKVVVEFTENGKHKLTEKKRQNSSYQVKTTIDATVKAPEATGKLVNDATVISNDGKGGGDTTTKTNEVETYWANVKIQKVDAKSGATLNGAVFELYNPGENKTCGAEDKTEKQKIKSNSETSWETKGNGEITIVGLHVNDFEDNDELGSQDQHKKYCLFEVKSPEGYELLSKPIDIELKKTDAKRAGEQEQPKVYELTTKVENLKDTTPELPMTGGAGVGILAAIGAAIIGAGAWFARRNSAES
ncbi:SpaH/EbpB family LPXTG-anchored major pilin [Corynebacterium diphtheriae]|uniref:SpaH/EbpB family LPXTG-anchored major pilin n=1 Tax=Corynebacterium diphtheriae TaxID=1717 RepID=UPI000B4BD224|nr:SpaH/EbpB family LPXTG-anchored major pilin [Corynebacterium diphtheriae]OWM43076.1 hypothetical protein BU164_09790 [Corynebacterium diphtheriae]OWN43911.1 hypothetical protein AY507_06430 [Corynebacterium diphtheriae bv. mitis]CAB0584301.1 LPXTG cell wall anchor domain-containing protein [Corynebacterium diphtheriae]